MLQEAPSFRPKVSVNTVEVYHARSGDAIDGWALTGQMDTVSAEADLWIATKGDRTGVVKLYRHNVLPAWMEKEQIAQKFLRLDHPSVAPILSYGKMGTRAYEISPFYEHGSLNDLMKARRGDLPRAKFLESEILGVAEQLTAALVYLHDSDIQHRDIKPANVLIISLDPLRVALADYGSASGSGTTRLTGAKGTLMYMAPEAADGVYSKRSDYWSFGMMVYEMILGHHPLDHLEAFQQTYAIAANNIPLKDCPARWKPFVTGLLCPESQRAINQERILKLAHTAGEEISDDTESAGRDLIERAAKDESSGRRRLLAPIIIGGIVATIGAALFFFYMPYARQIETIMKADVTVTPATIEQAPPAKTAASQSQVALKPAQKQEGTIVSIKPSRIETVSRLSEEASPAIKLVRVFTYIISFLGMITLGMGLFSLIQTGDFQACTKHLMVGLIMIIGSLVVRFLLSNQSFPDVSFPG